MGLTFAAPLALLGLLALPLIYWLLRVTPPAPRELVFPAVRLLRGLEPEDRTQAQTPWPLLLLRLAMAALAALAMAGPIWNWTAPVQTGGPLLVILDDGWASAPGWERRVAAATRLLDEATRSHAPSALLLASRGATEPEMGAAARELLRASRPKPWLPDRAPAAAQVTAFAQAHKGARLVWIADGLEQVGAASVATALREAAAQGAGVEVLTERRATRALRAPKNEAHALDVTALRAGASDGGLVEALDAKSRVVARARFSFGGDGHVKARFELPVEMRNEVSELRIAGEDSAGAVALIDSRERIRRVAIVSGADDAAQPLLSPGFYLERAFAPFTQILKGDRRDEDPVLAALADRPNLLVLADAKIAPGEAFEAAARFVEQGGVLLRFAGSRLANEPDDLLPVRLRRNTRVLGGALSWETPKHLAEFEEQSPFAGLKAPEEVAVSRQILAEPDPGLDARTWARLADGTPLVTFERRGEGMIVLFHVGAEAAWSNLPISGLFVEMLKRIVAMAGESAAETAQPAREQTTLAPLRTLDGFGALETPPANAKPLDANFSGPADADHPPGYYGVKGAELALQPLRGDEALTPLDFAAFGLAPQNLAAARGALDLRPALLTLIFLGFLIDWLALMLLSGRLRLARAAALGLLCALTGSGAAPHARAETPAKNAGQMEREAALKTRLAYVVTGDARVDETSRAGLQALSRALDRRTSFTPAEPVAVDVARDDLALYPLLYWPISATAPMPEARAKARVAAFMKQGGLIVFDTRDALTARANAAPTPETLWLRELAKGLDIPALEVAPRDHVITKTFYLLDGFVGRYANGDTYVEALPKEEDAGGAPRPVRATDNVSPVVITSNDLASGWAEDKNGVALYPLTPGGPRQHEMALRGGVNLVMYTLTGNYKSDQVHVRDLLQRLGQ
jgi:hypothetical protein